MCLSNSWDFVPLISYTSNVKILLQRYSQQNTSLFWRKDTVEMLLLYGFVYTVSTLQIFFPCMLSLVVSIRRKH